MHNNSSFGTKTGIVFLFFVLVIACSSPPTGTIILCAGDSITEVGYPMFLRSLLKEDGIRARVINQGKSGYNSKEYLNFLLENKTALAGNYPDFILLQLGTNDVRADHDHTPTDEYYANMKEIIRLFRDFRTRTGKNSRILLATIPPIPGNTPYPFTPESAQRVERDINPLIHKLATEEKISLVDNYSVFRRFPHFLPEVHPSNQGYEAMARNWYAALKETGLKREKVND